MGYLNKLLRKVEALDIDQIVKESVLQTLEQAAEQQRQQMLHGEDSNGNIIGRYRSPAYAELKERMNPLAGGYVDLYKTGAFQNRIEANIVGGELVIDSADPKTPDIIDQYGARIFGLQGEFRRNYIGKLAPVVRMGISSSIGLKFG